MPYETISGTQQEETPEQFQKPAKRWHNELEAAAKETQQWEMRVGDITQRYRDDMKDDEQLGKRFNIFWSNVQTLKPAIYSKTPKPQVERRYKDQDPIGRLASQALERCLQFSVQAESFDTVMQQVRDDYLIAGRGTSWVTYTPTYTDETEEEVAFEEVEFDYIHHRDFRHSPARYWSEVRWVAKRLLFRKDELKERFTGKVKTEDGVDEKEVWECVPLNKEDSTISELSTNDVVSNEVYKKAEVWEIWDKEDRKVYWVCKGCPYILDEKEDPLRLKDFFPCPRPLFATLTGGTLVPVPDFILYQDQAHELDELTMRKNLLLKAIRVAGVYDEANDGLQRLVTEQAENELIPIKGWQRFAERGGLKNGIDFLPIDIMANVLAVLQKGSESVKQEIYEITGNSDVLRGASNPHETAAAQNIKAQFASSRLEDRQREMQRFARDNIAIAGEIIAEHFSPDTIWVMGGVSLLPENVSVEAFMEAIELLRDDSLRSFRIDIETDSTIAFNREAKRKSTLEFMKAIAQTLRQVAQLASIDDSLMPFLSKLIMQVARNFEGGRDLEAALEQSIEASLQKQEEAKKNGPPPDPKMEEMKAKMQLEQQKMQMEAQKMQAQQQQKMQEMELKKQEMLDEMALEREKAQLEIQLRKEIAEADIELKKFEAGMKHDTEIMKIKDDYALKTAQQNGTQAGNEDGTFGLQKITRMVDDPENPGGRMAIIEEVLPSGEVMSRRVGRIQDDPENPGERMAVFEEQVVQ